MRILIALVLVAALGWSAYWFYGSRRLDTAIRDGLETLRENGVQVEVERISVGGFPNRFDTTIERPSLSWPSGIGWSAPFLQILALSYRPNQIIVAFPNTQEVAGPFGSAKVETVRARASALFRPGVDPILDHGNLVADDIEIALGKRSARAVKLLAATRIPEGASADVQNIGVTIDDLDLPAELAARLGGASRARLDGATLDATLHLSEPVTVEALKTGRLIVERIEIGRLDLDWGGMSLDGTGAFDVSSDGSLDGSLDLSVTNWRRALQMVAASGLLPIEQRRLVEEGADALAALTGGEDRLTAQIAIRSDRMWLGPIPIGPAPRL